MRDRSTTDFFIVVASWFVKNPRVVESLAHEALTGYWLSTCREFFKAPYDAVQRCIPSVAVQF